MRFEDCCTTCANPECGERFCREDGPCPSDVICPQCFEAEDPMPDAEDRLRARDYEAWSAL